MEEASVSSEWTCLISCRSIGGASQSEMNARSRKIGRSEIKSSVSRVIAPGNFPKTYPSRKFVAGLDVYGSQPAICDMPNQLATSLCCAGFDGQFTGVSQTS